MDAIEASAVLRAPREAVFDYVQSFSGTYPAADHLDAVEQDGDGGPGTEYAITVSWWRFSYTSESVVTAAERPEHVEWRARGRVRARGVWTFDDVERGTRLRLRVEFDPTLLGRALPSALPPSRLRATLGDVVRGEVHTLLGAMAEDVEGEARRVPVTVHRLPDSL